MFIWNYARSYHFSNRGFVKHTLASYYFPRISGLIPLSLASWRRLIHQLARDISLMVSWQLYNRIKHYSWHQDILHANRAIIVFEICVSCVSCTMRNSASLCVNRYRNTSLPVYTAMRSYSPFRNNSPSICLIDLFWCCGRPWGMGERWSSSRLCECLAARWYKSCSRCARKPLLLEWLIRVPSMWIISFWCRISGWGRIRFNNLPRFVSNGRWMGVHLVGPLPIGVEPSLKCVLAKRTEHA